MSIVNPRCRRDTVSNSRRPFQHTARQYGQDQLRQEKHLRADFFHCVEDAKVLKRRLARSVVENRLIKADAMLAENLVVRLLTRQRSRMNKRSPLWHVRCGKGLELIYRTVERPIDPKA